MRDFSWKYFVMTGDVDAYMLYKEAGQQAEAMEIEVEETNLQEQDTAE